MFEKVPTDKAAVSAMMPGLLVRFLLSLLLTFGPVAFAIWIVFWSGWHWVVVLFACIFLVPVALTAIALLLRVASRLPRRS